MDDKLDAAIDVDANSARMAALDRSHAVIELDRDGLVVTANGNYLDLFGYELEQITGQHHRIFCSAGYASGEEYDTFWSRLRLGEFVSGDFERIGASGAAIWVRVTYTPMLDADGAVARIVGLALDVTEERAATAQDQSRIAAIHRSHGVVEFDLDGHIHEVNEEFTRIMGYTRDELVGMHHRGLCDPAHTGTREYADFWARLRSGRFQSGEFRRIHCDGHDVYIQATYHPLLDAHGELTRIVKFAIDVTHAAVSAIQAANRLAAIERADAVLELDTSRSIVRANGNYCTLLDVVPGELVGRHHSVVVAPEDDLEDELWKRLADGQSMSSRFARSVGAGTTRWIETTYHPVTDADDRILSVVAVGHDVTAEVEYERKTRRRAEQDWLTGVANREVGFRLVDAATQEADTAGKRSILAFIDLDGFKQINDNYGHLVGDLALIAAAERLTAAAGPDAVVARLGGDEFMVIATGTDEEPLVMGERLRRGLSGPIIDDRHPDVHVTASVGLFVIDRAGTDAAAAIRRADLAAYAAKGAGRGCTRVYDDAISAESRHRQELEDDLRTAVRKGRLDVAFQPIVDLITGELFCAEALLRFDRPGTGLVDTAEIIEIAEASDLVVDIDLFVMERAFEQLAYWRSEHLLECDVSINLSGRSAIHDEIVESVLDAIERHGVEPTHVIVEVTEIAILIDLDRAAANMEALREVGIRVALDDFGARHASLGRLWDFPVDLVKLDERIASPRDERANTMLEMIVRTVQKLGHRIIAEGVESAEEQTRLLELAITLGQGTFLTAPNTPLALISHWAAHDDLVLGDSDSDGNDDDNDVI